MAKSKDDLGMSHLTSMPKGFVRRRPPPKHKGKGVLEQQVTPEMREKLAKAHKQIAKWTYDDALAYFERRLTDKQGTAHEESMRKANAAQRIANRRLRYGERRRSLPK